MESTPLNKAHEAGRRAVKLVRKGQLEEAIACHLRAAAILKNIEENLESDSLCRRSLEAQVEFHKHQAVLVNFLKGYVKKQGLILQKMAERPSGSTPEKRRILQPIPVQKKRVPEAEIHKQLEEADSLLQILSGYKYTPGELKKVPSIENSSPRAIEFARRPKNDADVIEELQIVNSNLRALVDKLLNELNQCREENKLLRLQLEKELEWSAKTQSSDSTSAALIEPISDSMIKSESVGNDQDILRQSMDISMRQAYDDVPVWELPDLDPLETPPEFDFKL